MKASTETGPPARSASAKSAAVTLFSMPVSNFGARARFVKYLKGLDDNDVEVIHPSTLGGMKSPEYLSMNPLGKVPAAIVREDGEETILFESMVIVEYLCERFADRGPTIIPKELTTRARGRLIAALLDNYVCPHHPFMYKKMDPSVDRSAGVELMNPGFDAIENAMDDAGPFVAGKDLSLGDCALWGNLAFYEFMLPTFFGWSIFDGRPKLQRWRENMFSTSEPAQRVYEEVYSALEGWWDSGRWKNLGMAAAINPKKYS